jgi:hypothetical protein
MLKRRRNESRDRRARENATSGARVELVLNLFASKIFKPFLLAWRKRPVHLVRRCNDVSSFEFEPTQDVLWQGIGEPKGDEVNRVVGFPVWKFAAATDTRHGGIVAETRALVFVPLASGRRL